MELKNEYETVSVDKAIRRGHLMVTFPTAVVMVGTLVLCFYLGIQKILPFWIVPCGFVISFVLSWICWSFMITRWRLWAFENVRNVHELSRRAVQEKLIWDEKSFFNKTEIRKATDTEKWNSLKEKFKREDIFTDDLTIPEETIIYYSKGKILFRLAIMLAFVGIGIYLMLASQKYLLGTAISLAGIYFSYGLLKEIMNTKPQIILNNKGMQTFSTEFYSWAQIRKEEVTYETSGKTTHFYLNYNHPGGDENILIDDYAINQKELEKLLNIYRSRSRNKHSNLHTQP